MKEYNDWRRAQGLPEIVPPAGKKRIRSLSLSDEAYEGLTKLAREFKLRGIRQGSRSVSAFVEAVGLGYLRVSR